MNRLGKRTALIFTPLLLLGLLGGAAWSQRSAEQRNENVQLARSERGGFHRGHHRGGHGGRRGRHFMARMAERLDLDDRQRKEIGHILTEARKKAIRLRADARIARIELGQLVTEAEVEQTRVDAKVDQIATLQGELLRERAGLAVAIQKLLTPEQRENADGMVRRLLNRGRRGHRR